MLFLPPKLFNNTLVMSHQKFILTISFFVAFTLKTFCQCENGTDSSTIGKYKYKVCAEIERDTFIVKRISIVSGLDYIDYELKKQIHKVDYYELILENKGGEERLVVSLPSRKHRNRIREGESYYFVLYPQFKKHLLFLCPTVNYIVHIERHQITVGNHNQYTNVYLSSNLDGLCYHKKCNKQRLKKIINNSFNPL